MDSRRQAFRNYPWTCGDDPWRPAVQVAPDLPVNIGYVTDVDILLRVNVKYDEDEISLYHDNECIVVERNYMNRKEYGYECYTSCRVLRRIALPRGLDFSKIDTWISTDGYLHLLAPVSATGRSRVVINVPTLTTRTLSHVHRKAINLVQEQRYDIFEQFDRNIPSHIYRNNYPAVEAAEPARPGSCPRHEPEPEAETEDKKDIKDTEDASSDDVFYMVEPDENGGSDTETNPPA